jgi:hypothetical protein
MAKPFWQVELGAYKEVADFVLTTFPHWHSKPRDYSTVFKALSHAASEKRLPLHAVQNWIRSEKIQRHSDRGRSMREAAEKQRDAALPRKVRFWVESLFRELKATHDFMDNLRWARVKPTIGISAYRNRRRKGCCGFYDAVHLCPIDSRKYKIGFNYGH